MSLWWLFAIIPAGLFVLLFTIYFFNLDNKAVSLVYKMLGKKFEKQNKETKL